MPARCLCFSPFLQQTLLIMASGALFPSLVSGSRGSSSKYLVEFRAGKMTMKGSTVTPDKRKGQVYIQQTDDSLIHFCWKDRTTGNVDDEPKNDKDDEYCRKVNEYLNNPPIPGALGSSGSGGHDLSALGGSTHSLDLASVLTPEVMAPILANPEVQQRLMPYLPSGESLPQSSEELHNTLSSPQFQQVGAISHYPQIHCLCSRWISFILVALSFDI
ncbi:hypothetical protein XENOCAPTIV_000681 [Xenoophorus captivus]|uniref:Adhesion regulating molecule 1 n=1 Tax=Xenoophorus captivus TaxID=1517983 RepID=A0ABV0QGU3_9TELE